MVDDEDEHGYVQRCQTCGTLTDSEYCSNECFDEGETAREAEQDAEVMELELLWHS